MQTTDFRVIFSLPIGLSPSISQVNTFFLQSFLFYLKTCPIVNLLLQHRITSFIRNFVLSAFSALTLVVGWQEGHPACKKLSGGMLVWLCVWIKVQICIWPSWCHCHSLSLAPVNPYWLYLPGFTFLVPAHLSSRGQNPRGPQNGLCVWVHVCVSSLEIRNFANAQGPCEVPQIRNIALEKALQ